MLTEEQRKWVDHLSDTDAVRIVPFDPGAEEKFQGVRALIRSKLGKETAVEHHGATSLGISGQDEIDVYVPVPPDRFSGLIAPLTELFGEPGSLYPMERARFRTSVGRKRVDVFLVNDEWSGWRDGLAFEAYLRARPEALMEYERLKEEGNGLSVREYYRRKIAFINGILDGV